MFDRLYISVTVPLFIPSVFLGILMNPAASDKTDIMPGLIVFFSDVPQSCYDFHLLIPQTYDLNYCFLQSMTILSPFNRFILFIHISKFISAYGT